MIERILDSTGGGKPRAGGTGPTCELLTRDGVTLGEIWTVE